jgi:hypothetical protein
MASAVMRVLPGVVVVLKVAMAWLWRAGIWTVSCTTPTSSLDDVRWTVMLDRARRGSFLWSTRLTTIFW